MLTRKRILDTVAKLLCLQEYYIHNHASQANRSMGETGSEARTAISKKSSAENGPSMKRYRGSTIEVRIPRREYSSETSGAGRALTPDMEPLRQMLVDHRHDKNQYEIRTCIICNQIHQLNSLQDYTEGTPDEDLDEKYLPPIPAMQTRASTGGAQISRRVWDRISQTLSSPLLEGEVSRERPQIARVSTRGISRSTTSPIHRSLTARLTSPDIPPTERPIATSASTMASEHSHSISARFNTPISATLAPPQIKMIL